MVFYDFIEIGTSDFNTEIEKEDDSSDDVESDDQNQFEEFEVDGNEEVKEEEYP